MAYSSSTGLLKIGGSSGVKFPLKYIYKDSYSVYINAQDLDSTRNANGRLQRNVLDHTATTITFTTKPMHSDEFDAMMKLFRDRYISKTLSSGINPERKIALYYFCPEIGNYLSGNFYMVQPQPKIMQEYKGNNDLRYDAMGLEFIEY